VRGMEFAITPPSAPPTSGPAPLTAQLRAGGSPLTAMARVVVRVIYALWVPAARVGNAPRTPNCQDVPGCACCQFLIAFPLTGPQLNY